MASSSLNRRDVCSVCGAPLPETVRHCPTCQSDAGAPNVRRCRTTENLQALLARVEALRTRIAGNGSLKEVSSFEAAVKEKSGVVVAMPAGVARQFFEDPNFLYADYERLVGAKARKPAGSEDDQRRCAVGGLLFGSYANRIVYGVLSLTEEGLPTYGHIYCRLRSITIEMRTSFLESNSYRFVEDHHLTPGAGLPVGHMACWKERHNLVLAKLGTSLTSEQTESDWQAMLIRSDGQNRAEDDFVEAHIFEGFDANAIESLVPVPGRKLSRGERIDLGIVVSNFRRARGKTK